MTALAGNFFFLIFPIVVAGVLHMLAVRFQIFEALKIPISEKRFGRNKTWRGVVLMMAFGVIGVVIESPFVFGQMEEWLFPAAYAKTQSIVLLGALLGLSYSLGELPNSYLKRRLGVPPGEQAEKGALFFFILDRVDSAIAVALLYFLWGIPLNLVIWLIPFGILVHLAVTVPLYFLGVKEKIL